MKNNIRYYIYFILFCFTLNVLTPNFVRAQLNPYDEWGSEGVSVNLWGSGDPIADTSLPGDLDQPIAPPPVVITTSTGEQILLIDGKVRAKVSTDQTGTEWTTFYLDGAETTLQSEWGENLFYDYIADGQIVNLLTETGDIDSTSIYAFGKLRTHISQDLITYQYDEEGQIVSSTDNWGNVTSFANGRPQEVTNKDGAVMGTYVYGTGDKVDYLEAYVDTSSGEVDIDGNPIVKSTTYFGEDGIRPTHVTNFAGETVQSYLYDSNGDLSTVFSYGLAGQPDTMTTVFQGQYDGIYNLIEQADGTGEIVLGDTTYNKVLVGIYNYDGVGNVTSTTDIGEGGIITGWTEYDDYGRVAGTYNAEGTLIQAYEYNEYGFLQRTVSLGGYDPLCGDPLFNGQVILSYTNFDSRGRPDKVWQVGDDGRKIKIQEYAYKANGLLDATYSLGVKRDEWGNALIDDVTGDFTYIVTSKTTYDSKGRPEYVYNFVRNDSGELVDSNGVALGDQTDLENAALELQQKYAYNSDGFLAYTTSYGFGGRSTGRTEFNAYSRPVATYNVHEQVTQTYEYNAEGFLVRTNSYGENMTLTGWTAYDVRGKPTDVFNHEGSLTQKYIYDENGLLTKTLSFGRADGIGDFVVATIEDLEALTDQWRAEWDEEYAADFGDVSKIDQLIATAWDAYNGTTDVDPDMTKAMACALQLIKAHYATAIAEKNDPAAGTDTLDAVATCFYIIGLACEQQSEDLRAQGLTMQADSLHNMAIGAYKVQIDKFSGAESVSVLSKTKLEEMDADLPVVTGYTLFGGDSRPIASYQYYEKFDEATGQSLGLTETKVQDYIYSYDESVTSVVGVDPVSGDNIYETNTVTKYTTFVRKTVNYGDIIDPATGEQEVTGYTEFDRYGRQETSYNSEGQKVQKYNYSANGFLKSTYSYGKDGALTGTTLYDHYSRPVASFNLYGRVTSIPEDLLQALSEGLTANPEDGLDSFSAEWQPYLKGLTQTFEYGKDGFLNSSRSWGEATEVSIRDIDDFNAVFGSVQGDSNYNAEFDFDENGSIDAADLAIFESAFNGVSGFAAQVGSVLGDSRYAADPDTGYSVYDYDQDGDVDNTDLTTFSKNYTVSSKYMPTYTGSTQYDKYGKASVVTNADGVMVQKYVYNERGFLEMSESYGILTDGDGNVLLDNGNVQSVRTGYTLFDASSKPLESYSVYEKFDETTGESLGEQATLSQTYEYENGFLVRTNNFGDINSDGNSVASGHTEFDKYGRQTASYNEVGQKTTVYRYSAQGFLDQTYNYGQDGAFLGKTFFDKKGRPTESYNMYGNVSTGKGLTQRFNYNEHGFLQSSTSFGENQTETGITYYDGYGKAVRAENEMGIKVSEYVYNERGFLIQTNNVVFVETAQLSDHFESPEALAAYISAEGLSEVNVTNIDGVTETGYYLTASYTVFNEISKPLETYQTYWDSQGPGEGVLVQTFNYTDGFVTSTTNYGQGGVVTGTTKFDKYGRQEASYNEFGEKTGQYRYSSQGFLSETYNYGEAGVYTGKTVYNDVGRPEKSYNARGALVQEMNYNTFSNQLESSTSYGELNTEVGTTGYDIFGKAQQQLNAEGAVVSDYTYDAQGFMVRANSYGEGGVQTGYTVYDATGRPTEVWNISEQGIETKVQDFIYNTNTEGKGAADLAQYVGDNNTGFLQVTINYGDFDPDTGQQILVGYTTFNRYGQQEASYNEYDELTARFAFSGNGFLSETRNYGSNGVYTGRTVFNSLGRPEAAYNERGYLVQSFDYSANGFLESTTTYGNNEVITGQTLYNAYGKQQETRNSEGMTISLYEYNDAGFLVKSYNMGFEQDAAGTETVELTTQEGGDLVKTGDVVAGTYRVTGYNLYNAASRPEASYSVYETRDDAGNLISHNEIKAQEFDYAGGTSGFITGTTMYVLNKDDDGNPIHTQTVTTTDHLGNTITAIVADSIADGEIIVSGSVIYDRYGRPDETYNYAGSKISENSYNSSGFLEKTYNYGENNTRTGTIIYSDLGRPVEAQNHAGYKTQEYAYDSLGMLSHTLGYSYDAANSVSVVTTRTEFDVYSKAENVYQLFTGTETDGVYQYSASGTANYDVNDPGRNAYVETDAFLAANGSSEGDANWNAALDFNNDRTIDSLDTNGALIQVNKYDDFGYINRTETYGRSGNMTSYVVYDKYSNAKTVYNDKDVHVQEYTYSAAGFLTYTTSYSVMKAFGDDGEPLDDGNWTPTDEETTRTYYTAQGQQNETYLWNSDTETIGAKQSSFSYNSAGFVDRSYNYQDGRSTGYVIFDGSGRQIEGYNSSGSLTQKYWYDANGFLYKSTQHS